MEWLGTVDRRIWFGIQTLESPSWDVIGYGNGDRIEHSGKIGISETNYSSVGLVGETGDSTFLMDKTKKCQWQ
jgi:hypothetical protein